MLLRVIWQCLEIYLVLTIGGVWWVEAGDGAKHSRMHGEAPTRIYPAPNGNSAELRNPGLVL